MEAIYLIWGLILVYIGLFIWLRSEDKKGEYSFIDIAMSALFGTALSVVFVGLFVLVLWGIWMIIVESYQVISSW